MSFKDLMEFNLDPELERAERTLNMVNVTQQFVSGKIKIQGSPDKKSTFGLLRTKTDEAKLEQAGLGSLKTSIKQTNSKFNHVLQGLVQGHR